jgi:hypothetical protein
LPAGLGAENSPPDSPVPSKNEGARAACVGADRPGAGCGGGDTPENRSDAPAGWAGAGNPAPRGAGPLQDQGLSAVAVGVADRPGSGSGRGGHAVQDPAAGRRRAGDLAPPGAVPADDQRPWLGVAAARADGPGSGLREYGHGVEVRFAVRRGAGDPTPSGTVPPQDERPPVGYANRPAAAGRGEGDPGQAGDAAGTRAPRRQQQRRCGRASRAVAIYSIATSLVSWAQRLARGCRRALRDGVAVGSRYTVLILVRDHRGGGRT